MSASLLLAAAVTAWSAPPAFSVDGLQGWAAQGFRGRAVTHYRTVPDDDAGKTVLEADCHDSASGMIWKQTIDLRQTPNLAWQWKIDAVYAGLHEQLRHGDDYPVRVYVVRDGGWAPWRTLSLVYVWSNGESGLSHWPDPYTRQAHIVALRRGGEGVGAWQSERRDVRADFQQYFGVAVDQVDAVALMSDCDDAHRHSRARYGDIRLLR